MDLEQRLFDAIKANTGVAIRMGYLIPKEGIGLVPAPGSAVIDEDYAGNQDWRYNYSITIRTTDQESAGESLFAIKKCLDGLTELNSNDNSFVFQSLIVSSAPALIMQDTEGNSTFALDLAVFVGTNKYEKG
jgi:hypothetical protein